jgi:hypothetical protein
VAPEYAREMSLVGKAGQGGDFGQRQVACERAFRLFDATAADEFTQRFAECLAEGP